MGRRVTSLKDLKEHKTYSMGVSGESGDDEQKHECRDELKEESFSSANLWSGGNPRVHWMIYAFDTEGSSNAMEPRICAVM